MTDERTMVTCRADLDHVWDYESFQGLVDLLGDHTDLDLVVEADETELTIAQGPVWGGTYHVNSFAYPFDLQDAIDWTYYFENDYTARLEIIEDVESLLDLPFESRDNPIRAFVRHVLLADWIEMDGTDLMIMDESGGPLELTACYVWTTETVGDTLRPHRPERDLPTRAHLYPDGRLVLSWSWIEPAPEHESGVTAIGPDRLVVDLNIVDAETAHALYDRSVARP